MGSMERSRVYIGQVAMSTSVLEAQPSQLMSMAPPRASRSASPGQKCLRWLCPISLLWEKGSGPFRRLLAHDGAFGSIPLKSRRVCLGQDTSGHLSRLGRDHEVIHISWNFLIGDIKVCWTRQRVGRILMIQRYFTQLGNSSLCWRHLCLLGNGRAVIRLVFWPSRCMSARMDSLPAGITNEDSFKMASDHI